MFENDAVLALVLGMISIATDPKAAAARVGEFRTAEAAAAARVAEAEKAEAELAARSAALDERETQIRAGEVKLWRRGQELEQLQNSLKERFAELRDFEGMLKRRVMQQSGLAQHFNEALQSLPSWEALDAEISPPRDPVADLNSEGMNLAPLEAVSARGARRSLRRGAM